MYSGLTNALYIISQGALIPVIVLLLIGVLFAVVLLAGTIVEYFTERRHFKVAVPAFLRSIEEASCQEIPGIIAKSALLKRQKTALMTLFNARDLPEEARWNTAKRVVFETNEYYLRRIGLSDLVAKLAPMVGLMGTLIPLGPGIMALGSNDITTLADSLLVAFDTTVVGLIAAAFCVIISKIRKRWTADYTSALESMQATLADRLNALNEEGDLEYTAPVVLEPVPAKEKKSGKEAEEAEETAAEEGID